MIAYRIHGFLLIYMLPFSLDGVERDRVSLGLLLITNSMTLEINNFQNSVYKGRISV